LLIQIISFNFAAQKRTGGSLGRKAHHQTFTGDGLIFGQAIAGEQSEPEVRLPIGPGGRYRNRVETGSPFLTKNLKSDLYT
jgi:hypothetical protein